MPSSQNAVDRFWSKVETSDVCWEWIGNKNTKGYGMLWISKGKNAMAHRFSYELLRGPIPSGLTIDHLCRNRACVNPSHMEPVDGKTNTLRGNGPTADNARKSKCFRGHSLSGKNLWLRKAGHRTERWCRICSRLRQNTNRALARARAAQNKEGK